MRTVIESPLLPTKLSSSATGPSSGASTTFSTARWVSAPVASMAGKLVIGASTALAGTALAGTALAGTALAGTALAGNCIGRYCNHLHCQLRVHIPSCIQSKRPTYMPTIRSIANDSFRKSFQGRVPTGDSLGCDFHLGLSSTGVLVSPAATNILIFPISFRPHNSPGAHNRSHRVRQNQRVPERLPQITQIHELRLGLLLQSFNW